MENLDSSAIEKVQEQIEKLKELIQNGLAKAQAQLRESIDKLHEFAHGILDKAKDKVHSVVQLALEQLKKINEDAAAAGVDVVACVANQDQAIEDLADGNLKALGDCIDNNVKRAGDITDEALNSINNLLGFVDDDLNRLFACDGFSCYLGLWTDVVLQLLRVPRKIILIIDHTILTIHSINKDVLLCNADTILQVGSGVSDIVSEVKTCVNNAMSNNTMVY